MTAHTINREVRRRFGLSHHYRATCSCGDLDTGWLDSREDREDQVTRHLSAAHARQFVEDQRAAVAEEKARKNARDRVSKQALRDRRRAEVVG